MRGRPRPVEEFDEVVRLHATGLGFRRIARLTGIPEGTVSGWLYDDQHGDPRSFRANNDAYRESPLPRSRRCTQCLKTKGAEHFYLIRRPASGAFALFPECKECKRKRERVRKALDPEGVRRRDRESHHRRKNAVPKPIRLPKGPLVALYLHVRREAKTWMIQESDLDKAQARGGGNVFGGTFDRTRFAEYLGLTMAQLETLERITRSGSETKTVEFGIVDAVYTNLGVPDQLQADYPGIHTRSRR